MSDDEMLPPPRTAPFLKNDDFRKIMMTPRAGAGPQSTPRGRGGQQQKERKPKPHRPKPPKPEETKAEQDEAQRYRDRAEERRRGINPDYDHLALPSFLNAGDNAGQAELQHLSIEETKFLGGDVSHTHMVKGLDFQLLNKIREEMAHEGDPKGAVKAPAMVTPKADELTFVTPLARRIYDAIFRPPHVDVASLYRPRRTAFVYDFDDPVAGDVPTTLRRSKQDCPKVEDSLVAPIDGVVLERIAKIMSYMHMTGRKSKKKDKATRLNPTGGLVGVQGGLAVKGQAHAAGLGQRPGRGGPVDEDDDIFEDAGKDYAPAVPSKDKSNGGGVHKGNSYFSEAKPRQLSPGAEGSLPPPPLLAAELEDNEEGELHDAPLGPARPAQHVDPDAVYGAYAVPAGDAEEEEEDLEQSNRIPVQVVVQRTQNGSSAKTAAPAAPVGDDAYAECYPEYHGMADGGVDSEDEDFTHMDGKRDPARHEFATEEEWQNYKANKEQLPKAAFQFGVKAADGRRQGKNIGKQADNKINNDLNQIKNMLTDKYGDRHAAAFNKDKQSGGELVEEPRAQRSKRLRL